MVLRVITGASWSLATGLAGAWLLISPWALGEQTGSGDWTNVTKTQFWTGAGLVALAVVGLVLVAAQIAGALRGAPAGQPAGFRSRPTGGGVPDGAQTDAALVALANALVADLNRQSAPAPTQHPQPGPSPQIAQQNGPPYQQAPQPPATTDPWRPER